MNRASPIEMRKSCEMAEELKKAGILFIPIPVLNEQHKDELFVLLNKYLDKIAEEC